MLREMRLASWGRVKFPDIVAAGGWRWTRSSLTRSGPEGSSRNESFLGRRPASHRIFPIADVSNSE